MTLSGLIFFLLGVYIAAFIAVHRLLQSRTLPFLLFVCHLSFSLFYWYYSLHGPSDARRYFNVGAEKDVSFGLGTRFIEWLVQQLQWVFSGSFLDLFLLFHLAGFMGICFLYRAVIETVHVPVSSRTRKIITFFLFLPGLNFWTSAIGKDSLFFFGINLSLWALILPKRRWFGFCAGCLLMFLIRPHMAVVLLVATGIAVMWGRDVPRGWQIMATIAFAGIMVLVLPLAIDYVGLQEVNIDSVDSYVAKRQGYNMEGGSSVNISNYPFVLKVFTYLYRPLFFDISGAFSVVVSVENLILLIFTFRLLSLVFLRLLWGHPHSFFLRVNFFYFLFGTSMLALTTPNLGIAIRSKTMLIPSLLILILSKYAIDRYVAESCRKGQRITFRDVIGPKR